MSERLRPAPGGRAARALDRGRQWAGDGLAGRTVWSVAGLPDHDSSSGTMIAHKGVVATATGGCKSNGGPTKKPGVATRPSCQTSLAAGWRGSSLPR